MLNRLSIKSKLVIVLILVSLFSSLLIGYISWLDSQAALEESTRDKLEALRYNKAIQVDTYFRNMRHTVEVLSENDMVVRAMVEFSRAFRQLENRSIPLEWDAQLQQYYTTQFFPRLFANLPGQPDYALYRPQNQAGIYLQYQYIAQNSFEDHEKYLLDRIGDKSDYNRIHEYYNPLFRNLVRKWEFEDLILVNIETGDVIYTVSKQADIGSNLDLGPYRRSNQARALEAARSNTERGAAQFIDFELNRPGYGFPSAFWSAPIYNGKHLIGVIMIKISTDILNKIMKDNDQWLQTGLGKTGEAYLVGADNLMRSDSRFRVEDPEGYQEILRSFGTSNQTTKLIDSFGTTSMVQVVSSDSVNKALQNQSGIESTLNYLRQPVMSSYQPIVVEGFQWALITEMSIDEAFETLYIFQRQLLISTVIVIALLAFLSIGISNLLMNPINRLKEAVRKINAENYLIDKETILKKYDGTTNLISDMKTHNQISLDVQTNDEVGELSTTFNDMLFTIEYDRQRLEQKTQESTYLLDNLLPVITTQRIRDNESDFIDEEQQVTVVVASIVGLDRALADMTKDETNELLEKLYSAFGTAEKEQDIEAFTSFNQGFIGFCGFSSPHLDHGYRVVSFVQSIQQTLEQLNKHHNCQLTLRAGIHTGSLFGSATNTHQLVYNLWGEAIYMAQRLHDEAISDVVLVSEPLADRLREQFNFQHERDIQWNQNKKQEPLRRIAWVLSS
ncbi:MAG: adenylate/guanylate cyclase domain-containing protein [Chloroflexota bacterium]